ncbi:unnamed protein product [marine sediment metagenome]|uniref:Uncharacterized protein n=1 Tax=marine sediment metagenome TaxID=412755 RepID=X0WZQ1_9ZZZZ
MILDNNPLTYIMIPIKAAIANRTKMRYCHNSNSIPTSKTGSRIRGIINQLTTICKQNLEND